MKRLSVDLAAGMTAAEVCKYYGLKGLTEASELCDRSVRTLQNWHKDPDRVGWFLFHVEGAVARKHELIEKL